MGLLISTLSSSVLPIRPLAKGLVIESFLFSISDSYSPTIWYSCFSPLSSSSISTVAPNLILSPSTDLTSITSALLIALSKSIILPSIKLCCSLAYWYSAFSDRSPWLLASAIASIIFGLSSDVNFFNSSCNFVSVSYTHLTLPTMS